MPEQKKLPTLQPNKKEGGNNLAEIITGFKHLCVLALFLRMWCFKISILEIRKILFDFISFVLKIRNIFC